MSRNRRSTRFFITFYLLLLNSVSYNTFATEPSASILSIPIEMPRVTVVDTSYPKISDWYQFCKEADTVKSKADWGLCVGYMYAAVQQIYQISQRKCSNFSVEEIMRLVDAEAIAYEKRYSYPSIDRDGKEVNGARTYQPGKLTAWQRPAFPVLVEVMSKVCNRQ